MPYKTRAVRPLRDRIMEKIKVDDNECWLWQGAITGQGYAYVNRGRRLGAVRAHRALYEIEVGPVPEGLDLDHLCRVRHCVNPQHLEPVTRQKNVDRGEYGAGKPRPQRRKRVQNV